MTNKRKCAVLNCPFSRPNPLKYVPKNCTIKFHVIPQKPKMYEAWADVIPLCENLVFNEKLNICSVHFKKEDYSTHWIAKDQEGNIVQKAEYKRARLNPDAIPSIFPDPLINSLGECKRPATQPLKVYKRKKSLMEVKSIKIEPGLQTNKKAKVTTPDQNAAPQLSPELPIIQSLTTQSHDHIIHGLPVEIRHQTNDLFSLVWNNVSVIKLPAPSWAVCKCDTIHREVIFSEMKYRKTDQPRYIARQVIMSEESDIVIFLHGKKFMCKELPPVIAQFEISEPSDFSKLLSYVHNLGACSGGPYVSQYPNCQPKCGVIDQDRWRHKLCTFVFFPGPGVLCVHCSKLFTALTKQLKYNAAKK